MAKLKNKSKDNPKLEQRVMLDGKISLYLEYYLGRESEPILDGFGNPVLYESGKMKGKPKYKVKHLRKQENLNLHLIASPRTPVDRQLNKETLQLAKKIRQEREQELLENRDGYRIKKNGKVNLLDYFQEFAEKANGNNRWVLIGSLKNFKEFLKEKYPIFAYRLEPKNLSKDMVKGFVDYLVDNHKGMGAKTYYKRFKTMVNYAVENGEISKSPCKGIVTPKVDDVLVKDILSQEELKQLFATHYKGEKKEVRRAFAMTCLTGIRFCDIKALTYNNVDYSNKLLMFRQIKTQSHSSKSGVTIPLNDALIDIIGEKEKNAEDDLIFHLPSAPTCLKTLDKWAKKAGINKHITWHCGRHSFATNLLINGANIKVVSSLLGHASLQFTEVYVRAVDKLKEEAINSLPELNI